MRDVPDAKKFTVEDIIVATVQEDNTLLVEIYMIVKFSERSFLRFAIESNSYKETAKWMKQYFQYLQDMTRTKVNVNSIKQRDDINPNVTKRNPISIFLKKLSQLFHYLSMILSSKAASLKYKF